MTLHLAGKADTSNDNYDIEFDATQTLGLYFDAANQRLIVQAVGAPDVKVHAHGPFLALSSRPKPHLGSGPNSPGASHPVHRRQRPAPTAHGAARQAQRQHSVSLDDAEFGFDGVVLRGTASMRAGSTPAVSFVISPENDGFSALTSWIPGWADHPIRLVVGMARRQDRQVRQRRPMGAAAPAAAEPRPLRDLDRTLAAAGARRPGTRAPQRDGSAYPPEDRRPRPCDIDTDVHPIRLVALAHRGRGRPAAPARRARALPGRAVSAARVARSPPRGGRRGANTLVVLVGCELYEDTLGSLAGGPWGSAAARCWPRRRPCCSVTASWHHGSVPAAVKAVTALGRKVGAAITINEDVDGAWSATPRCWTTRRTRRGGCSARGWAALDVGARRTHR